MANNVIGLHFNDFKQLADNHRVYYYVGEDYYDFHYLVDAYWIFSPDSLGIIAAIGTQNNSTSAYRPQLEITYTTPSTFVPQVMIF